MRITHGKFPTGDIYLTPGAQAALRTSNEDALKFVNRHVTGDWGDVPDEDKEENEHAIREGLRILSAYRTTTGTKLWVITEADRSATTILLPEEY